MKSTRPPAAKNVAAKNMAATRAVKTIFLAAVLRLFFTLYLLGTELPGLITRLKREYHEILFMSSNLVYRCGTIKALHEYS